METVKKSIELFQLGAEMALQYYNRPIVVTFSGGKDSDVLLEIAKRSGSAFEVQHSLTTVDAPETVRHVKETFSQLEKMGIKCTINKPKINMWQLIEKKGLPPMRQRRYCCQYLKETCGRNIMIATGVRWEESNQRKTRNEFEILGSTKKSAVRIKVSQNEQISLQDEIILANDNHKKRQFIERCERKASSVCNPIIHWTSSEIWQFIKQENISYNPLYDKGFHRVGCVGCPMASQKEREKAFAMFPTYKRAYIRAFDRMIAQKKQSGKETNWNSGKEVFNWWVNEKSQHMQGQIDLFEEMA